MARRSLWASEMPARRVVAISEDAEVDTIHRLDDEPGGLGWTPDSDLLVVSTTRRVVMRARDGGLEPFASLAPPVAVRANDMLVDPRGHAYVGDWGYDFAGGGTYADANLAVVGPDGTVGVAATGLGFPNGMALGKRRGELLVARSVKGCISSLRMASDGCPTVCASTMPGGQWVADPVGRSVVRVERGGEIADVVAIEGRRPYACALDGEDGHTLFICVAESFEPEVTLAKQSGALLALGVDVKAPVVDAAPRWRRVRGEPRVGRADVLDE